MGKNGFKAHYVLAIDYKNLTKQSDYKNPSKCQSNVFLEVDFYMYSNHNL